MLVDAGIPEVKLHGRNGDASHGSLSAGSRRCSTHSQPAGGGAATRTGVAVPYSSWPVQASHCFQAGDEREYGSVRCCQVA
ncbi:hypothetical protein F751_0609 [Auxenochlorella protothecoides]|uniref:Uncharacterized protein n=1 Tax=Auxenochlorella protothecoides TaxID=3075 RepID=A0A087SIM8_AUXPR|nr:hypothetical protein F751_0609 [Auxenochlorella protothecoides]KFM25582.1 hypothetical protein F751_0609 [Auxenochlorella protothecoides]